MATQTDHSHGSVEPPATTDRRPVTRRLREAAETIGETLLRPTSIDLRARCQPDGDWRRTEDWPLRRTWQRNGSSNRVQLSSPGIAAPWRVVHQTPDGRSETISDGLEREAAYAVAERYMADLSSVEQHNRTGRAASE